jgi:hypothetical protein
MNKSLDSRKSLRVFIQDNMENLIEENYSKLKECIKESVESEQCYINYDDENFALLKPYIITEEDPSKENLAYLESNFGINSEIFQKELVYQDIDNAIEKAKESKINRKHDEFSDDEDMDPWNFEFEVDISKGISDDDYNSIMSMRRVIHSYFCILKRNFKADIPKKIVKFLVKNTTRNISSYLQSALYKCKDKISLVNEDADIRTKREIKILFKNSSKHLG